MWASNAALSRSCLNANELLLQSEQGSTQQGEQPRPLIHPRALKRPGLDVATKRPRVLATAGRPRRARPLISCWKLWEAFDHELTRRPASLGATP